MPWRAAWAGGATLALLAGCASSGLKPYPDELAAKNLSIHTAITAGSAFSSVRAALDVYSVDASCRTQYLGTVELDRSAIAVGVPAGRMSYLVFNFLTSGFLGGARGHISRATLLKPQADARYEIDVSYRDDLYDVMLRERPARAAVRELPLLELKACR
jgi:hypothetical protein